VKGKKKESFSLKGLVLPSNYQRGSDFQFINPIVCESSKIRKRYLGVKRKTEKKIGRLGQDPDLNKGGEKSFSKYSTGLRG